MKRYALTGIRTYCDACGMEITDSSYSSVEYTNNEKESYVVHLHNRCTAGYKAAMNFIHEMERIEKGE